MPKTVNIRAMLGIGEKGSWAIVGVTDDKEQAVQDVIFEVEADGYFEVYELVIPVQIPKRQIRQIRISPEALNLVAAEVELDEDEEEEEEGEA